MNVFNDIRCSGSDIYFVIRPAFVLITMYLVHVQSIIKSIIPGKFQDGCQNSYKFPIFQIEHESTFTPTVRLYCASNHLFLFLTGMQHLRKSSNHQHGNKFQYGRRIQHNFFHFQASSEGWYSSYK